jgi:hypothetical protein
METAADVARGGSALVYVYLLEPGTVFDMDMQHSFLPWRRSGYEGWAEEQMEPYLTLNDPGQAEQDSCHGITASTTDQARPPSMPRPVPPLGAPTIVCIAQVPRWARCYVEPWGRLSRIHRR